MAKYGLERRHKTIDCNNKKEEKRACDPVHVDIKEACENTDCGVPPVEETSEGGSVYGGSGGGSNYVIEQVRLTPANKPENCTSILPGKLCGGGKSDPGSGILYIIKLVSSIMTGGVITLGTVGLVICGFMMMSARDDAAREAKAKKRLVEIIIGIIAWVLISFIINLIIPMTSSTVDGNMATRAESAKVA